MTEHEQFIADLRDAAATLGCRLVVLPPHGSDAEPVEILP